MTVQQLHPFRPSIRSEFIDQLAVSTSEIAKTVGKPHAVVRWHLLQIVKLVDGFSFLPDESSDNDALVTRAETAIILVDWMRRLAAFGGPASPLNRQYQTLGDVLMSRASVQSDMIGKGADEKEVISTGFVKAVLDFSANKRPGHEWFDAVILSWPKEPAD